MAAEPVNGLGEGQAVMGRAASEGSMARGSVHALTWLVTLTMAVAAVSPLSAQTIPLAGVGSSSPTPAISDTDQSLPHDLDRIRRGLTTRKGVFVLHRDVPVFRVEIREKLPGIEAWLGDPKALWRGPFTMSPYHQEFLDMVTPPEARASFTSGELLQILLTGLAGKLAARALDRKLRTLRAESAANQACQEVRQTLVDLNIQRQLVGLPAEPLNVCP